jgi:hypothetical protein
MSQQDDNFDYKLGGDDEDEDENYTGDDIYTDPSGGDVPVGAPVGEELDFYAITALDYANVVKWNPPVLRQRLFEEIMKTISDSRGLVLHDLILSCDVQDEGYIALVVALYPSLERFIRQIANPNDRGTLVDVLGTALSASIWTSIADLSGKRGLSVENFGALTDSIYGEGTFEPEYTTIADYTAAVISKTLGASVHDSSFVAKDLALLKAIAEGADVAEPTSERVPVIVIDDEPAVDEMEVESVVNAILKVYDNLYAPCFINRPMGVLTSEGILKQSMGGGVETVGRGVNFAKRLYSFINKQTRGYLGDETTNRHIDSSFISADGKLLTPYSPAYHLKNINGIKDDGSQVRTWTEFRRYLHTDLTQKVRSVLGKVESEDTIGMQSVLIALFTNCIIIDKFDVVSSMSLKLKVDGLTSGLGTAILANTKGLFGKDFGEIINEGVDAFGIYDLLYVFDVAAYTSEILFSYKAHESLIASGNTPSISNVVVGKGLDGKDVTVNLGNELNILTGIVAGSGSGKGVLTLNILASLFAEGCPVMYLDYKPDMAGTLWQMERYLQGKGHNSRIFAIDSKEDRRKDGATPLRSSPYGTGNTGLVPLTSVEYGLFPYLKTLQFASLLATARTKGIFQRKEKMFFILDETQGFSRAYLTMLKKLQEFEKSKAKTPEAEDAVFAKKLITAFGAELRSELSNVRDVTGRTGLMGLILLGQKVDPEEWKVMFPDGSSSSWKESFAALLMSSVNLKFVGKAAGTSPSYALGNVTIKGKGYIDDKDIRGYWALSGSVKPTNASTSIFKSYLTLNDNDFNPEAWAAGNTESMPYTGGVLGGISDAVNRDNVINNEFLQSDGSIRDTVGFLGLMKLIGGADEASLAEKVSRGYNQMEAMFNLLGLNQRYSCVEEYLYDCSPESVFTYAELRDLMNGDASVDGSVDGAPLAEKDWLGDNGQPVNSNPQGTPPIVGSAESTEVPSGYQDLFGNQNKQQDPISDVEEPDLLADDERTTTQPPRGANPPKGAPQPQAVPQQPNDVTNANDYKRPADLSGYEGVYNEEMTLPQNPFRLFGTSDRPISALSSLKMMSKFIMDEILRVTGDYGRVESLEFTSTGMVINNYAFRPRFEEHIIESMPFDIKSKVAKGNIIELFHFENIYKFKNLAHLRIDNSRLAEGRVRREISLHPKKSWVKLFDRFRNLQELYIGGERITDQETAQQYDDRGRGGFSLTEKLREKLSVGLSAVTSSRMDKVWDSKPVRVIGKAAGWTLAAKTVAVAAAFLGPWGLLFGGLAAFGAYKHLKKRD